MKKLSVVAARRLTDRLILAGWVVMLAGAVFLPGAYGVAAMIVGLLLTWLWVPIYTFFRDEP